jgi:hypothetical protein
VREAEAMGVSGGGASATAALARVVVGGIVLWLGVQKYLDGVPTEIPAGSLLRYLENPVVWFAIATVECLSGPLLVMSGRRLPWIVALCALVASILVHGVDAGSRGWSATGCGCFGSERYAAGVDFVRICALFMATLAAHRLQGLSAADRRTPHVAALILGAAVVLGTPLIWSGQAAMPAVHAPVARESGEVQGPSLTGLSKLPAPSSSPVGHVPSGLADALAARVTVRVLDPAGVVLPGPVLSAIPAGSGGSGSTAVTVQGLVSDGGLVSVPKDSLPTVPFLLRADVTGFAPGGLVVTESEYRELVIHLAPARTATVVVVNSLGEPLAGIGVDLLRIDSHRDSSFGLPALPPARAETSSDGRAKFHALERGMTYVVSLTPGQGLVRPLLGGIKEYLLPDDSELRVVVSPAFCVWMRPVDDATGMLIETAAWSAPHERDRRFELAYRGLGDERSLGLGGLEERGDHRQVLHLLGEGPTSDEIRYGRYTVTAPGYAAGTVEGILVPLQLAAAKGPQLVRLRQEEPLGRLRVAAPGDCQVDHLLVELRGTAGKWKSARLLCPALGETQCEFRVPAGRYVVFVAGARHGEVAVSANHLTQVDLTDDAWAAVTFRVLVDGQPAAGPVTMMFASSAGRLLFTRGPVALREGRTPAFAVPKGDALLVSVSGPTSKPAVVQLMPIEVNRSEVQVDLTRQ